MLFVVMVGRRFCNSYLFASAVVVEAHDFHLIHFRGTRCQHAKKCWPDQSAQNCFDDLKVNSIGIGMHACYIEAEANWGTSNYCFHTVEKFVHMPVQMWTYERQFSTSAQAVNAR